MKVLWMTEFCDIHSYKLDYLTTMNSGVVKESQPSVCMHKLGISRQVVEIIFESSSWFWWH